MVDGAIIATVRRYLQALADRGIPIDYGIIFGSQAAGGSDVWSDIDLLVVSSRFDGERRREDINLLWRTAAQVDSRLEPIAVGRRQWEQDDSSAIIEIARRGGEMIRPS
jgi:predicted nucleotidyltransferase